MRHKSGLSIGVLVLCLTSLPTSGLAQENGTELFRNLFAGFCDGECPDDVDRLVYTAPDDLEELLRSTAEDLFARGEGEVQPVMNPERSFGESPVTLVLLPGIFGEFIPLRPFEEILAQGGAFADRYAEAMTQQLARVYVMREEVHYYKRFDDVVDLASFDQQGRSLINLVFFKPRIKHNGRDIYTLESMGTVAESAAIYLDRLSTLMELLNNEDRQNVYLVGYSRGAIVGLELLRLLGQQRPSWATSVRGLVSLAGPLWGTTTADVALPESWLDAHLRELSQSPVPTGDRRINATESVRAMVRACQGDDSEMASRRMLCDLSELSLVESDFFEELNELIDGLESGPEIVGREAEAYDSTLPGDENGFELTGYLGFLARRLAELGQIPSQTNEMQHNLRVNDSRFFRRIHQLFDKVYSGVAGLSREARLQWWESAGDQLPEWVQLYSIVATMPSGPDESGSELIVSPLYDFVGYGHDTHDFRFLLRGAYFDLLELELPVQLNDSQVSVDSVVLQLGPENSIPQFAQRETIMAVLGTHHWGLAFPTAFPDTSPNTYPREILFRTIGAFLAETDAP